MTRIKKGLALVLVLMITVTAGVFTAFAAETAQEEEPAGTSDSVITIHVRQDGLSQPYIYVWNSLPTNDAMSQSYPGERMTASDGWHTYTITGFTKVNAIITDAQGNQYSSEKN